MPKKTKKIARKTKPKVKPKAKIKAKAKVKAKRPIRKTKTVKRKLSLKRELLLEEKLKAKRALPAIGRASSAATAPEANGGEITVGESKFQLGPKKNAGLPAMQAEARQAGEFQAHNLPFEYGKNRVILLVVDPKFIFVYWEVQAEKMHEALNAIGHNAKLTLRFTNLDTNHSWDISIYERVGNWYLKLDHPEQNLAVEIGMKNDRGEFSAIARSNTMKLPRAGLAPRGPIKWMLVLPTGEKLITEVEDYTDADLELLKKILGPYFFDLLRRGKFWTVAGSSAENIFTEIEEIRAPSISS